MHKRGSSERDVKEKVQFTFTTTIDLEVGKSIDLDFLNETGWLEDWTPSKTHDNTPIIESLTVSPDMKNVVIVYCKAECNGSCSGCEETRRVARMQPNMTFRNYCRVQPREYRIPVYVPKETFDALKSKDKITSTNTTK